jgi:hypothetical protein
MASSGGSSDGGIGALLAMQAAQPMPGLPVAGKDSATGDPYEYGQFQNFLPDVKATGQNDVATGLRPDMFAYRKPNPGGGAGNTLGGGAAAPAAGGGADPRTQLAAMMASGGGGGGGPVTGFGPPSNGLGPPPGAQQLPTPPGGWGPGNVPGWPAGGPGTPIARPGDNTDPLAAAAAAAANRASGG